jgi:hypothetical protein
VPTTDYIPAKDSEANSWATNFQHVLSAAPTDYGTTSGDVTSFATLRVSFTNALEAATDPGTRTSVTVAAKDVARNAMVFAARALANTAQATPGITAELLNEAGLTIRQVVPTPISAPTTKPLVAVVETLPLAVKLQIRDVTTPASRAKPFGAVEAEIWGKIDSAPASIDDCSYLGSYTKPFKTLEFAGADAGKKVYLIARWKTRTGLVGPSSDTISATIPHA